MDALEYLSQVEQIKTETQQRLKTLARTFAYANNTQKIGDIVQNNVVKIKIESWKFSVGIDGSRLPEMVYYGTILKKDNTPMISQKGHNYVYQSTIIKP